MQEKQRSKVSYTLKGEEGTESRPCEANEGLSLN